MKRNILLFLIFILILTSITGCKGSNEIAENGDNLSQEIEEKEITIIMSKHSSINNIKYLNYSVYSDMAVYYNHLNLFTTEFTEKTGIKVKTEFTSARTYEEYLQIRNTQLYLENGPELILISGGEDYNNLVKEGVALEIEGKIPNYKNAYDALKDGYFVPMAIGLDTIFLSSEALENLNLEKPKVDWTEDDFHNIMNTFYSGGTNYIIGEQVYSMINSTLKNNKLFLNKEGKIRTSNEEMVKAIEDLRYELLESGRFKQREDYKYENYYNMLYKGFSDSENGQGDPETNDYYNAWTGNFGDNPLIFTDGSTNSLNALETYKNKETYLKKHNNWLRELGKSLIENENFILLPRPYPTYSSWGFILNRNGKNVEEALEFLNMLLSDEAQFGVYTDLDDKYNRQRAISYSTPIVETIEEKILAIENEKGVDKDLIDMRIEVLNQIKEGKRTRNYRGSSIRGAYVINTKEPLTEEQERLFKEGIEETIVKIVFADEKYTSEAIMGELRNLDNRITLMFSE